MPARLVAAFALYCCAAASATVITFPPDIPVPGGHSVGAVCGDCCQSGSYCGKTSDGKAMTCILRDRSVFGAVDGGLCVPGPLIVRIEDFCQAYKSVGVAMRAALSLMMHLDSGLSYSNVCRS